MNDEKKESGDRRVWTGKYESALHFIETGNIVEARKILGELSRQAPYEELRKDAAEKLEQFKPDWLAYVLFGTTLLVLLVIILKWVF